MAGAVAGIATASWAIATTMVVSIIAAMVIAQVPITPCTPEHGRRLASSLRSGLGLLWRSPPLRGLTVATTVSQGTYGLVVVAFLMLQRWMRRAGWRCQSREVSRA